MRRALDVFAADFLLAVDVFAADFLLAVDFFALDFLAPDFFALDFFLAPGFLAVDFFAVDFLLAGDFLAVDFFLAGDFLAVDFFALVRLDVRPPARAAPAFTLPATSGAFSTAVSSSSSTTAPITPWAVSVLSTFLPASLPASAISFGPGIVSLLRVTSSLTIPLTRKERR